jgi:beta-fructofuranosidase
LFDRAQEKKRKDKDKMTTSQKKKWTDAERYRPYSDYSEEYTDELKRLLKSSPYLPSYHIHPRCGLLNDPNGFGYFNGQWQLFYQAFPYGPVHGLKSWESMTSPDLVHWSHKGQALWPDTTFDQRGVYSGSALSADNGYHLFYTGNSANEKGERLSCQMHALMDKNGIILKDSRPVIAGPPVGYTAHFRDPQVFIYDQEFRMLVGAQRQNLEGAILVYRSRDLRKWDLAGELNFTDEKMGYMVECPNLVFVNDRPVLIFCPQGLSKNILNYKNIFPNLMLVGNEYNDETLNLTGPFLFQNFDEGFEFYAAQAINAPDGRILVVGWIGLPDVETPTWSEGWAHCLSLVRDLSLTEDGKIYSYPVVETKILRSQSHRFGGTDEFSCLQLPKDGYELELILPKEAKGELSLAGLIVKGDLTAGEITVDRSSVAGKSAPLTDTIRTVNTEIGSPIDMNIFIDRSVFEIFINHGEKSLTGRFFPISGQGGITWKGTKEVKGTVWEISAEQN